MDNDLQEFEVLPPERPVFLKVLCMLTFIGSSYTIINSAIMYFTARHLSNIIVSTKVKMYEEIEKKRKPNQPETVGFAVKVMDNMAVISRPENLRKTATGNIVASLFCLAGAILMWRLNKTGFYLYVVGTIISIVVPFYLFGNNFLTVISTGFACFFGILFVVFYAMNIRSMH